MPPRPDATPTPFLRTPLARIILVIVAAAVVFTIVRRLERVNLRHQTEKRLAADSLLGPMVKKLRQQIESAPLSPAPAGSSTGQPSPVALYFGHVGKFAAGKELHGLPATQVLHLTSPILLAGQAGKNDTVDEVAVSWKDQLRGLDNPEPGQEWIVAVWRDASGNNVAHTAERCEWR